MWCGGAIRTSAASSEGSALSNLRPFRAKVWALLGKSFAFCPKAALAATASLFKKNVLITNCLIFYEKASF
jgi:hypothetical protein